MEQYWFYRRGSKGPATQYPPCTGGGNLHCDHTLPDRQCRLPVCSSHSTTRKPASQSDRCCGNSTCFERKHRSHFTVTNDPFYNIQLCEWNHPPVRKNHFCYGQGWIFFKKVGQIHPLHDTPSYAILIQALWAVVLVWSGSFDTLTDLLIFASFIFYGSAAFGVVLLRKREPATPRPYRVPLIFPVIFSLFCLVLVVVNVVNQPIQAAIGLALIISGVPFYLFYTRSTKP